MTQKSKRKRYLIHPSSQFKYMAMSVLPALFMSIFFIYFLQKSGQLLLQKEEALIAVSSSSIEETIAELASGKYSKELGRKIDLFEKKLKIFKEVLRLQHFRTVEEWARINMSLLVILGLVLFCVGAISLLYSHRIAGPICRMKKSLDQLSEGRDISAVTLRRYDEFKELAGSLEKLRKVLLEKGFLKQKPNREN